MTDHGTRQRYQRSCRCLRCRAAEARYRADLRRKHRKGLPILGAYVSASEAWARIRVFKQEHFTTQQITGWRNRLEPIAHFTSASRVRLKTLLRLRALYVAYLIDEQDLPNHKPYDGPTGDPQTPRPAGTD